MLAVVQRINGGEVVVEGRTISKCDGLGLLILLGETHDDTEEDARLLGDKIAKLRIFSDENDKMNLSVLDVDGGIIVVSNFTLYGSYRKGNRPDYMNSAHPSHAEPLYEYFKEYLKKYTDKIESGEFGADMKVRITNDGPVTLQLDSNVLRQPKK